jgi:hypothetical protein
MAQIGMHCPRRDLFPALEQSFLKFVSTTDTIGRVYSASGRYPVRWDTFRRHGPADCRFDHHPSPRGDHPRRGIVYGVSRNEDPNFEVLLVCLLAGQHRRHRRRGDETAGPHLGMARRDLQWLLAEADAGG